MEKNLLVRNNTNEGHMQRGLRSRPVLEPTGTTLQPSHMDTAGLRCEWKQRTGQRLVLAAGERRRLSWKGVAQLPGAKERPRQHL